MLPVAFLWKPYQVIRELHLRASGALRAATVLQLWWTLWVIANFLGTHDFTGETPYNHKDAQSDLFIAAAAVLAVQLIRTITREALTPYQSLANSLALLRESPQASVDS